MTRLLFTFYHLLAYHLSFLLFGTFGLALSLFCLSVGWLRTTPRQERLFQHVLHHHFALWIWWLSFTRLVRVKFENFSRLPQDPRLVLVCNHPGLMDITYLLARLPEAFCVFKPAVRRNPILGAAARRAGYLASDGGHDLLRAAADKVAAGNTFIVFPEGTRSPLGSLYPFKPGFVVVARRAAAPIQLVRIACDSDLLSKGRPWWKVPRFPALVTVKLGPCLPPPTEEKTHAIVAEVEAWYRDEAERAHTAPSAAAALSPAPHWQPAS